MNNTITRIKNPENTFKSRLDRDEDGFSKVEYRPKENIRNKKETKEQKIQKIGEIHRDPILCLIDIPERLSKRMEKKQYLKR